MVVGRFRCFPIGARYLFRGGTVKLQEGMERKGTNKPGRKRNEHLTRRNFSSKNSPWKWMIGRRGLFRFLLGARHAGLFLGGVCSTNCRSDRRQLGSSLSGWCALHVMSTWTFQGDHVPYLNGEQWAIDWGFSTSLLGDGTFPIHMKNWVWWSE